ncbi:hypothetical protein GCM10023114_57940 [Mycolicibacterium sediminis]|uniref:Uncharacterized protein n=1 Tax=Mycolicibacterium sediminis TaxID=1286180 RepID=A0A7I7QPH4_9MYCO|nr:hypothetical protein MSEDJ_22080 [Mycolicibacterium sediminis]
MGVDVMVGADCNVAGCDPGRVAGVFGQLALDVHRLLRLNRSVAKVGAAPVLKATRGPESPRTGPRTWKLDISHSGYHCTSSTVKGYRCGNA